MQVFAFDFAGMGAGMSFRHCQCAAPSKKRHCAHAWSAAPHFLQTDSGLTSGSFFSLQVLQRNTSSRLRSAPRPFGAPSMRAGLSEGPEEPRFPERSLSR